MPLKKATLILCALIALLSSEETYSQGRKSTNKIKGVVELGSEGFNSFIIRLDKDKNWKLVKSQFGKSYLIENASSNTQITEGLINYIAEISEAGVNSYDIHFVVSSGAASQYSTAKIISIIEKMGYIVNMVSAEKEGQLAFRSVVPDSRKNETLVIDVGSSNTKISWLEKKEIISISTHGSKYFKNNISDTIVCKDLNEIASMMPESRTKSVYLIGGMPYKYAKQTRHESERYTKLDPIVSYTPKDEKERCGALILKKLQDAGRIEEYIFDWDSNFAIGFLLELPY